MALSPAGRNASLNTVSVTVSPDPLAPISPEVAVADKIVNGAKAEVRRRVVYDASYQRIGYPGGDVAAGGGACTDVVIRALRHASYDLQKLIHEDMVSHPGIYPHRPNSPDTNIDHRRVTNQIVYMKRFGLSLPLDTAGAAKTIWQPGDLVYWKLDNGLDHCGVISNVQNALGLPLVIHNIGQAEQADVLTMWKIVGHFRFPKRSQSKVPNPRAAYPMSLNGLAGE